MSDDHLYRRGVGIMLLNAQGQVWVGARVDNRSPAWQMPQGGMDEGEEPWTTALRELEEETGIAPHLVERIACTEERLRYDLPEEYRKRLWRGQWIGQEQDWFLCRFLGIDDDVNIAAENPEFREWKWIAPAALPDSIVPFKRELYEDLLRRFAQWL
jgi:putative (di)nucleoside polyphosphate hydrolase